MGFGVDWVGMRNFGPKLRNMPSSLHARLQDDLSPLTLSDGARVWTYTASRVMTSEECTLIQNHLEAFTSTWAAHGKPLKAQSAILGSQIVVLALDESDQAATGCSIDASVTALKVICDLAPTLRDLDLFDRAWVLYATDPNASEWQRSKLHAFWAMRKSGNLNDDVPIVDSTVATLGEMRSSIVKPLADSWHAHMW